MAVRKQTDNDSAGEDKEQLALSFIARGKVKMVQPLWRTV
jgi:hypothetical protein